MRCKGQKGQSLVETALVMPIVLLVLCAIIDFGLLFNNYIIISNASREAARLGAVGGTDSEITQLVQDMTTILDQSSLRIVINPIQLSRNSGDPVTISIEYDYHTVTPFLGPIIGDPTVLQTSSVMRVE